MYAVVLLAVKTRAVVGQLNRFRIGFEDSNSDWLVAAIFDPS